MFGHFNSAELAVLVADKMNAYRQEAELERQLPRHALRHRIAWQLGAWALALEPSQAKSRQLQKSLTSGGSHD